MLSIFGYFNLVSLRLVIGLMLIRVQGVSFISQIVMLKYPTANSHTGFEYIWNEIPVLITFESDWKLAKELMLKIAIDQAESLSVDAQNQIRRAARKYLIVAGKLTPIVYTSVKDSGVMLTIRYLVNPRMRRGTEQKIWEELLSAFNNEANIELAYPTMSILSKKILSRFHSTFKSMCCKACHTFEYNEFSFVSFHQEILSLIWD